MMRMFRRSRGRLTLCLTTLSLTLALAAVASPGSDARAGAAPGGGAVAFDRAAPPDTVPDLDGFRARIYHEGRLYIGGQPDSLALRALADRGVTAVVNLRTPGEMDDRARVPFDEQALARELGLDYVWIPLGGDDHPYTPAAVDTFAAALERHPGPVLLHCTVGWRASHMWAAYLVRHAGFAVDEAYARGVAIGIGEPPLAELLDMELILTAKP
ncbi:hypothetical protein KDM41_03495 [bacterium]|nr:hypothetical protein [bacterium]